MAKKLNGAALVAEYQSSGMTIRAFCRQKGIQERTFFYHRKRAAKIEGKANGAPKGFVRLQVPMAKGNIGGYEIRRGGTTICLPPDFSPEKVGALLALLPS
jgi:hypothetical protein